MELTCYALYLPDPQVPGLPCTYRTITNPRTSKVHRCIGDETVQACNAHALAVPLSPFPLTKLQTAHRALVKRKLLVVHALTQLLLQFFT